MHRLLNIALAFLAFLAVVSPAGAAPSEKRLALVIGNASYKAKALATPVNDAALIAQTLEAAGFDVIGARDLDENLLRQTFSEFVDRVAKAGPDTVAVVYFAGYGLQFEGENYLVPIDADITDASDVPVRALRLSEQTHAFAASPLKAAFVILDMARASPFILSGQPLAGGLAWVEPEANMLIAFNAAPGTMSPDDGNGYGPYAMALTEMIRQGGLTPADVFGRVRLRVNEITKGAQVPWDTSKAETQFMFFERGTGAPLRADSPAQAASMRSQPMRSLGALDAYMVALTRDTFDAYADFLADYWHDPMTNRVRAVLAARREAITWRRTYQANVPDAYWSYLERYPRGPHVADARRLLARLRATIAPPSKFAVMEYDVPPPLPDELEYIERSVLVFDDPGFAFESPQPSPVYFLEPPPSEFLALAPPAAPSGAHILPAPMFVSLPAYVSVPAVVVAPPNPVTSSAHETPVINTTNDVPTRPDGQAVSSTTSSSGTAASTNEFADSQSPPSSVAPDETLINSQTTPPPAVKPVASEEIKASPSPPLPAVSLTSLWPTENKTSASPIIEPPVLMTNNEPPISDPTMMAPLTDRPLQIWGATMLSPRPVGIVPLPRPRPALRGLLPDSNRSKPIPHTASTLSPIESNQAEQPTGSLLSRLWTNLAPAPEAALGASPPKPQKKLCPIVNGTRTCS